MGSSGRWPSLGFNKWDVSRKTGRPYWLARFLTVPSPTVMCVLLMHPLESSKLAQLGTLTADYLQIGQYGLMSACPAK